MLAADAPGRITLFREMMSTTRQPLEGGTAAGLTNRTERHTDVRKRTRSKE